MRLLLCAILLGACATPETKVIYIEKDNSPPPVEYATLEEAKSLAFLCATYELPLPGDWDEKDGEADSKAGQKAIENCIKADPSDARKHISTNVGTYHSGVTDGEWANIPWVMAEAMTQTSGKTIKVVSVIEQNFNCSQDPNYRLSPEPEHMEIRPSPGAGANSGRACSVKNGEKFRKQSYYYGPGYPAEKILLAEWEVTFMVVQ